MKQTVEKVRNLEFKNQYQKLSNVNKRKLMWSWVEASNMSWPTFYTRLRTGGFCTLDLDFLFSIIKKEELL